MSRLAHMMIGRVFGTLLVVQESWDSRPRSKRFNVQCRDCGARLIMSGGNLRRVEKQKTSGCKCGYFSFIHGLWEHPAYGTWNGMIRRCYNETHEHYDRYGGRGISVCEEWRKVPVAFIKWLEENGWRAGLQIDRIDNDGDYAPGNCQVVEPIVNANNKSTNRLVYIDGGVLTISQAARKFGVKKTTLKERLNRGWSDKEAVHGR